MISEATTFFWLTNFMVVLGFVKFSKKNPFRKQIFLALFNN